MFKTKYIILKSFLSVILLLSNTAFCISQQPKEILSINSSVGNLIDTLEKTQYNLFPGYSNEVFRAAQFYRNEDKTIDLHIYLVNNEKEIIRISEKEYSLLGLKIYSALYRKELERPPYINVKKWNNNPLYTSEDYITERRHKTFVILNQKKLSGDSLTLSEQAWLKRYNLYLEEYYDNMSDEERGKYKNSLKRIEKREKLGISRNAITAIERANPEGFSAAFCPENSKALYTNIPTVSIMVYYENYSKSRGPLFRNIRGGMGVCIGDNLEPSPTFLLNSVYLMGKRDHHAEVDFGVLWIVNYVVPFPLVALAYRYQKPDGGFLFRFGAGLDPSLVSVSFGYSF